jgi:hypothetical protein
VGDNAFSYNEQLICEKCYTSIEQSVQKLAEEKYPALVELFRVKYGKEYYSFEEFCSNRISGILHNHYYRKIMKRT